MSTANPMRRADALEGAEDALDRVTAPDPGAPLDSAMHNPPIYNPALFDQAVLDSAALDPAVLDPAVLGQALDRDGFAVTPPLIGAQTCAELAQLYESGEQTFRSTVTMARYGFGSGEYKYFARPLPAPVTALRGQSRPMVVPLRQGAIAVIPVKERPVQGARGASRVQIRHGVSTVHRGLRRTLGLIFHDAA